MRKIILILAISVLGQVTSVYAQTRQKIDDLQSIELRVDKKKIQVDVHYPNYRMGGGTPPTREIVDCFILDILDSDNQMTIEMKERVAKEIKLTQGFHSGFQTELIPTLKGSNIVFKILSGNLYMTTFTAGSREDRALKEVLDDVMPATRQGNYPSACLKLIYPRQETRV